MMIRFIDLSEVYWTDPEEHGGSVCAFLETRTDRFMTANGSHVFSDAEDIDDIEDASVRERCREHVPDGLWEGNTAAKSAIETRRLQTLLDRVTHERNCLGEEIADAAYKAGIYSGKAVTGPESILMVREMVDVIVRSQVERDERVTRGETAVVDGQGAE